MKSFPADWQMSERNPGSPGLGHPGLDQQSGEANKKSGNAAFFAFPE